MRHVRDWPLGALVWGWWGVRGWRPAIVVGYTRARVRLAFRDPKSNLRQRATAAPNRIFPRRRGGSQPQVNGEQIPACLRIVSGEAPRPYRAA